jgi:hypothetical protein
MLELGHLSYIDADAFLELPYGPSAESRQGASAATVWSAL